MQDDMTMNATIEKFGYPENVLDETDHWVVLLRPQQVTAGSMVLACKEGATSLSQVTAAAYSELPDVTAGIERALARSFRYDKINYLALMMVDREVHFHVLPRYSGPREAVGVTFTDGAWPGPPDISRTTPLTDEQFDRLRGLLRGSWT
jgi:diadenosine tetraphosphate (Ap4A) HIT family hydrolase